MTREFPGLALVAANHREERRLSKSSKDKKEPFVNGGGKKQKKRQHVSPQPLVKNGIWFTTIRRGS